MNMDKKPLRPNGKRGGGNRSVKNAGFVALVVLVALGIVAIALMAGTQATMALTRNAQRQSDLFIAPPSIDAYDKVHADLFEGAE